MQHVTDKIDDAHTVKRDPWSPIRAKEPEPAKVMCYGDLVRQQAEARRAEILANVTGISGSGDSAYVEKWEDRKAARDAAKPIIVTPAVRVDRAGRLNKTSRDRLLIAYKNGEPLDRIAKRFGVNKGRARAIARQAGVKPRRGGWPAKPPEVIKAIKLDWDNGLFVRDISKRHGLSVGQVTRICRNFKKRKHWRQR